MQPSADDADDSAGGSMVEGYIDNTSVRKIRRNIVYSLFIYFGFFIRKMGSKSKLLDFYKSRVLRDANSHKHLAI